MPPNTDAVIFDSRRKHAVLASAALVSLRGDTLRGIFQTALDEAFTPPELVELILQSHLFDGYPCALEGLLALKELLGDAYQPEDILEAYSPSSMETWRHRGDDLCRRIYGDNYEPLLRHVGILSPTLREWMLMEGYGRVLSRPSLSIDLRELGIIAILTVKNLPRQLHSHLRGALRVGVSSAELEAALHLCSKFTTSQHLQLALTVWRKINSMTMK